MGTTSNTSKRLERAADIARLHEAREGFLGAFAFGSGVRPYADDSSDLDVGILIDGQTWPKPAGADIHEERRRASALHRDVDLSFWTVTELSDPPVDAENRLVMTCVPVSDPRGALAAAKARVGEKLEEIREARMRVHYMDIQRLTNRVTKAYARERPLAIAAARGAFVVTAAHLLFVVHREWPGPAMWLREELEAAGVPRSLCASLVQVADATDAAAVRSCRRRLEMYTEEQGVTFGRDPIALWDWSFNTAEGRASRARWGGLASLGV